MVLGDGVWGRDWEYYMRDYPPLSSTSLCTVALIMYTWGDSYEYAS